MATEKLYDVWARRNPKWEIRFEDSIIRLFVDYGKGASELTSARGKALGAGYELYIYAFFVGLYANRKRELLGDTKDFGHQIQFWEGSSDTKTGRKKYPRLREYIFTALIAKTDLDLIALEKGTITDSQAVDVLKDTMEQYANYGFYAIEEKLKDNPNYFYKNTGFLDMILDYVQTQAKEASDEDLEEL